VLADALRVNTAVTTITLDGNKIGNGGALALIDALKVNTSVTMINLDDTELDESYYARVDELTARNKGFRQLFLFDARQMLMSRLCSDEFGVLWSYFFTDAKVDDGAAPDDIESIRVELAAVVKERRRRELCRPVLVADFRKLQCETNNQIVDLKNIVVGQTNQIAGLQKMIVEQNQQMQEQNQQMQDQIRQMHTLLLSREQEPSTGDVDERDKRAVKRRRTGR
jgi:hypothetical protein